MTSTTQAFSEIGVIIYSLWQGEWITLSRVLTHPSVTAFGDFRDKCYIFTGRIKVLITFLLERNMDIEDEKQDFRVVRCQVSKDQANVFEMPS